MSNPRLLAGSGVWKGRAWARTHAVKIRMPGYAGGYAALASSYGKLREQEAGGQAVRECLVLRPEYPSVATQELLRVWSPDLVAELIDGIRKAGMEFPDDASNPSNKTIPKTQ